VRQRRLTFTADRRHPGVQGPRHWLRSSPDGSRIGVLMRDDAGVVQLFTVSPEGGDLRQVTRGAAGIETAFTWSPDGRSIACGIDGSIGLVNVETGELTRLTPPVHDDSAPRPEACVISPDGRRIAYARCVPAAEGVFNQIFVVDVPR
jgi:Tol biopolymer transport system component